MIRVYLVVLTVPVKLSNRAEEVDADGYRSLLTRGAIVFAFIYLLVSIGSY